MYVLNDLVKCGMAFFPLYLCINTDSVTPALILISFSLPSALYSHC